MSNVQPYLTLGVPRFRPFVPHLHFFKTYDDLSLAWMKPLVYFVT